MATTAAWIIYAKLLNFEAMSVLSLIAGLIPLLLFVIVDSFFGLRKGIVVAALAAIAELVLSIVMFKSIDAVSVTGLVLVLVMGFASWKMNSPVVFKMQPVVLGLALSGLLLGSYALNQPLFVLMVTKYQSLLPAPYRLHTHHPPAGITMALPLHPLLWLCHLATNTPRGLGGPQAQQLVVDCLSGLGLLCVSHSRHPDCPQPSLIIT